MIKGGFILQPRSIDTSEIMHRPPIERELWLYILRNVNHKDNGRFKRGSGFFQLTKIAEDLSWYVGARKMRYKIPALSKALRRLSEGNDEGNLVATTRATRGIIITVCNYDYYQDPSNYEGNDERTTKAMTKERRRQSEKQECKEYKDSNNTSSYLYDDFGFNEFWILYDKKVGREDALRKWIKLSQADRDSIMAYIPKYKQIQPNKQYRKNPTTFITHRGWEDELFQQSIFQQPNNYSNGTENRRYSTKDIPASTDGYESTIPCKSIRG